MIPFVDGIDEAELLATSAAVKHTMALGCIDAVDTGIREAVDEARRTHRFQDRTYTLGASIGGSITEISPDGARGEMHAGAPYASFVEDGTKPHVIRPKADAGAMGPLLEGQSRLSRREAKAIKEYNRARGYGYAIGNHVLSWINGSGVRVFARAVRHPGTKPMPFMGPAFLKAERVGERVIREAIPRAQEKIDHG